MCVDWWLLIPKCNIKIIFNFYITDIIPVKMPARVALAEVAKQAQLDNKELLE